MKGSSDIAVVQRSLIKLRPSRKVKEAPSEFPALGGSVENSSAEGFGDLPAEDGEALGWRVIRVWECDIRKSAGREENLSRLYDRIVGAAPDLKPSRPYAEPEEEIDIAAEPAPEYGADA